MTLTKSTPKIVRYLTSVALVPTLIGCFFLLFASAVPTGCASDVGTSKSEGDAVVYSTVPLELASIDKSKTHILIEKTKYQLHLYEGDSLLKTYKSVFGSDLDKDKYQQGDGRTPEGFFTIKSMYDHDKWTKFIWIDYPNQESWQRFNARMKEGMIPTTAKIGGDIGIHGVPAGYDHAIADRQNWTLGCISLTTGAIRELYALVQVGTQIEIVP
jgi:murein L,D-transpeptidase YafK